MRFVQTFCRAVCFLAFFLSGAIVTAQAQPGDFNSARARLTQEVRHKLLMLPNYSIFDNLQFEITGANTVVLLGQVTRPSLKNRAEMAIMSLDGLAKLVDKIELLPLSPSDDRIRLAAFHAIFSRPGLEKYGIRAVAPIHIIVQDGNITLIGTVADPKDKDLAGTAAMEVPGALHVANDLRIETDQ